MESTIPVYDQLPQESPAIRSGVRSTCDTHCKSQVESPRGSSQQQRNPGSRCTNHQQLRCYLQMMIHSQRHHSRMETSSIQRSKRRDPHLKPCSDQVLVSGPCAWALKRTLSCSDTLVPEEQSYDKYYGVRLGTIATRP